MMVGHSVVYGVETSSLETVVVSIGRTGMVENIFAAVGKLCVTLIPDFTLTAMQSSLKARDGK